MAMKNILSISVILSMGFISCNAFADAEPPNPVSEISLTEAVESASYTNYFQERYEKESAWRIEFTHPVQNDHSVVYKVTNQKQLIFLYATG